MGCLPPIASAEKEEEEEEEPSAMIADIRQNAIFPASFQKNRG